MIGATAMFAGSSAVSKLLVVTYPVDEVLFSHYLYTAGSPDPDLIVRTSGELRVSNFLIWQGAYAELVFVDALWPDFGAEHFAAALAEYARRERRFGARPG